MIGFNPDAQSKITTLEQYRASSLKSKNFDFDVSGIYRKGNNYYVDITINVKNTDGAQKYYDKKLGYSLYYVPLKFDLSYSLEDDCIRDYKSNESKYPNYSVSDPKTIIKWKHRTYEYIWSKTKDLEGWTFTGETKEQ